MKKYVSALIFTMVLCQSAWAQTLGEALKAVTDEAHKIVASQPEPQTWGSQQASDDLNRLAAQAQRLEAALTTADADDTEKLQQDFLAAAHRLNTSKVMLGAQQQAAVEELVQKSESVDKTLSALRMRFGSKASSVNGSLADFPLASDEELVYRNVQDLLIDVRTARELSSTLQYGIVQQFRFTLTGGGPNNLDGLQVRRLQLAAIALERDLTHVDDVRSTIPAWDKFYREYNRLGYTGTGSNVRQFDRVVSRLHSFYSQLEK